MKYAPIPSELFVHNRARLAKKLKPNSVVIAVANDILPTNADGSMPFRQNSDLFWLTGVDQEETILMLYPDAHDREKQREMLFLRETSEHIAIWEGEKLTRERAAEVTGIDIRCIHWLDAFDTQFKTVMAQADHVYLNTNEHDRAAASLPTRERRFVDECRARFPLHRYERLAKLMHQLRPVKHDVEVRLLQEACDITAAGFERVARFVKPGVGEWEVEAELAHEFIRRKSRGFAYNPIIATGKNGCVLHYVENHAVCQDGELLLLDVAAEYANYNADLTRTIPVNGRFTKRQRQVYEAVLRVFRECCAILRPGITQKEWNNAAGDLMERELIGLKLLSAADVKKQDPEKPLYKKYFMHGLGHHLGLDVHDVGLRSARVEVGNVFTVEPGIYIREEGLAVRLENDIVVGKKKNHDLMGHIPIEADEIEALMNDGVSRKAKR